MPRPTALVLAAALPLLLAGCGGEDGPRVQVGEVERADVAEVVEAPGAVVARAASGVVSPAAGTVSSVLVRDGAQVEAGQVLLRLSSPQAQQDLSDALAAQLAAGQAGDPTAAALAGAQVSAAQDVVDALAVRAPIAGTVTLGGALPASDGLSGLLPGGLPGGLADAAAGLLGGGGAPAATTTTASLSPGAPVGEGTPLLTVTDTSGLGVLAEVDETDVLLVEPGVEAEVELDAVPGTAYRGRVVGVDLQPTTSARGGVSYRVRLSLVVPGGEQQPRPGMSAVVDLRVRESEGALSVPSAAVVRDGADDVVFLVEDGVAVRTPVRLGAQGEDRVELLEGVEEGDRLVVADADTVSDGDAVDA